MALSSKPTRAQLNRVAGQLRARDPRAPISNNIRNVRVTEPFGTETLKRHYRETHVRPAEVRVSIETDITVEITPSGMSDLEKAYIR